MKLEYTLNDNKNGLVVTDGKDLEGELVIPSEDCLGGKIYPVIAIGEEAFCACSALTSIVIPDSVIEIGKWAFSGCSGLTSIIVDKENRHYDSREGCNAIIESKTNTLVVGCPTTVIPDSVPKIGNYAFRGCKGLTSIVIPDSVTKIGNYAFSGCSGLTSIVIPNSVTEIGNWVFYGCSGLTSIVIPDSVIEIGNRAFCGCSGLTSIVISDASLLKGTVIFKGVEIVKP